MSGSCAAKRPVANAVTSLEPEPLEEARNYLALVAQQWENALGRLKDFVEKET